MKKDQKLPNKIIHTNNSSKKPLPNHPNYSRNQSPYNQSPYRSRSPEEKNSRNFSQNRYSRSISKIIDIATTIHDRIQTDENICLITVPNQTLGIDTFQTIDLKTHPTIATRIIPTIEIEVFQIIEINITQTTDQDLIQTTIKLPKIK